MNGFNPTGSWVSTMQWGQIPTSPSSQASDFMQMHNSPHPVNHSYQQSRVELITRLYRTILGRDPDSVGLEYYLRNSFIPEHQIAKDMYESTEHADLLMKAKDVMDMLARLNDITQQLKKLKEENQQLKQINDTLAAMVQSYKSVLGSSHPTTSHTMQQDTVSAPQNINVQTNAATIGTSSSKQQQEEQTYIIPDPFAEEENKRNNPIKRALSSWFKFD